MLPYSQESCYFQVYVSNIYYKNAKKKARYNYITIFDEAIKSNSSSRINLTDLPWYDRLNENRKSLLILK